MSKDEVWPALNKALVEVREADQRGDEELADKKYEEAEYWFAALGEVLRG
jgi:hypothetical protein